MLLPEDEIVEGVQGSKIEFEFALVDENGRPVDTTVYDEYKICLKIDSSTTLEITHVANGNNSIITKMGNAETGVFKALINPLDSVNIPNKTRQDIHFQMNEAADPTNIIKVVFKDKLAILSSLCA